MNKEKITETNKISILPVTPPLRQDVVICNASHQWDKREGVFVQGRPHIGIKGKWTRTCIKCGYREYYSKGMFTGWFSVP